MDSSSENKKLRVYSISTVIITIGILALIGAAVISLTQRIDTNLLICLGIALACLIGALAAVLLAKKHIQSQEQKKRLNPYANVDKKEIDKVLDMISREEVRRQRSEDFAAGIDLSGSHAGTDAVDNDPADEDELRFLVIDDHEDEDAPEPIALSAYESDEYDDASESSDSEKNETEDKTDSHTESAYHDTTEEKEDDDLNRGYDDYDDRAPRRRSPEGADRRERDPYRDPYYDDYYDDRQYQRGPRDPRDSRGDYRDPYARDREPVYYNEYGEPVRRRRPAAYDPYYDDYYAERPRQRGQRDPRMSRDPYASRDREGVYYNEYGEPVRRRRSAPSPYDDRRQPSAPRRRRPDGYPDGRQPRYDEEDTARRPAAAPTVSPIEGTDAVPAAPEAAPAPAPAPKAPEYDENYVPVVIPDDDYDYDAVRTSHSGRAGVGALHRTETPSAPPPVPAAYRSEAPRTNNRYSDYDEIESMPVALPDDEYFENRYSSSADRGDAGYQRDSYRSAGSVPPPPPVSSGRGRDRYVPDYEEEEMVISLPRDDEYESYLEHKREEEEKKREEEALAEQQRLKEQKKAERIASGKIVLTIVKIRRKKIRRKSRKYKQFRASVTHLNDYLHSFSAKTGRT